MDEDMRIPEPWHCGDCVHWRRCSALIGTLRGDEPHCDFAPSRFRLDAVGVLARLVDAAGATLTLYGQPVTGDELRSFGQTLAMRRVAAALATEGRT